MAGWHHDGVFRDKACVVCGTTFKPTSGVNKFCSTPCRGKWKYITGSETTETQYKKINGNWRRYFSRLRAPSHRKELSVEFLIYLLGKQNGLCALTGMPLTCNLEKGVRCATNASVDRIEAGGPYNEGNVRLVCIAINMWRGAWPDEDFVSWCRRVVEMAKPRDYKHEYETYQGTPEQLKNQSTRHKARRAMAKKVGKAAIAGKDVHHKNGIENGNGLSNLAVMSKSKNRSLK